MKDSGKRDQNQRHYCCSACGKKIREEDSENFGGLCWACWGDQLTEESEDMFGDLM